MMMLAETLSVSAAVLGGSFRSRLHIVLYPLVEIGGYKCDAVRSVALLSLENIAQSCEYKSAIEMVQRNSDYFVNTFSQRMRFIRSYPQTPQVCVCEREREALQRENERKRREENGRGEARQEDREVPIFVKIISAIVRFLDADVIGCLGDTIEDLFASLTMDDMFDCLLSFAIISDLPHSFTLIRKHIYIRTHASHALT